MTMRHTDGSQAMRFKVEFADSGISRKVVKEMDAPSWDAIDIAAEAECKRLVAAKKLHANHAYVGTIELLRAV